MTKMIKARYNKLKKDKVEHKIVSYFILRKLSESLPLEAAKKLTLLLMTSKELLDMTGLGTPEIGDIEADEKGIEEGSEDAINEKPYRYEIDNKRLIKDLLIYLRLEQ
jgi:hypothetical protein